MTRLPGRHRLSGEQVLLFLENIRERLTLIALTGDEYHATIKEAAEAGVIGGTIYDALIARCALKAKVDAFTLGIRDTSSSLARRLCGG